MTTDALHADRVRTTNRSSSTLTDRVLLGLGLVGLAAVASLVAILSLGLSTPGVALGGWKMAEPLLGFTQSGSPAYRLGMAAFAAAVGLASIAIAFRPLSRAGGPLASQHLVTADEGGVVLVDTKSIETVAVHSALRAHGVIDARVRVSGSGTSPVRLRVEAGTHGGADLKRAGEECLHRVRSAVEQVVGVEVRDVIVDVYVAELQLTRRFE